MHKMSEPIQIQPTQTGYHSGLIKIPPGLEYLTQLDHLLVRQNLAYCEAFCSFETGNQYTCMNADGQQCFRASETSAECQRQCCCNGRKTNLFITDTGGRDVLGLSKPLALCHCLCGDACQSEIAVESPFAGIFGYVRTQNGCFRKRLHVTDSYHRPLFFIDSDCYLLASKADFSIFDAENGLNIGVITRKWRGFAGELFGDLDLFSIQFPIDLPVEYKALLIGAMFLIDIMFFET